MTALLITAISVGVPSLCWMIVRCRASAVTQRITEKALRGCPAAHRANIFAASAELASQLGAERARRPITLSFNRSSERARD